MSRWQIVPISELCEYIVDCLHETPEVVDNKTGYLMIRTSDVKNGRVTLETARNVSKDTYFRRIQRGVPLKGDIVITREAPLGEIGEIPLDDCVCLGQRLIHYKPDYNKVVPRYLLYALLSPLVQAEFHANKGVGSVVDNLRMEIARSLSIPFPPLSEQRAIAEMLGALDDKIENNRQMNATLEATARALFKEWFVDFRYPGHEDVPLVDSELGLIPQGWRVLEVQNFCDSVRDGTHNSPKPQKLGRYLITSRHIIGHEIDYERAYKISDEDFQEINRRSKVHQWDVLITMIGTVGEIFLVREQPQFTIKNIGLFKCKTRMDSEWLYLYLSTPQSKKLIDSLKGGTTQSYITLGQLRALTLIVPPQKIMDAFANVIISLSNKITATLIESRALMEIRDALLPKLMSGELRIGEV